ncbi:MAG: 50S ribosomal protein L21 [Phycisphaeraceae bacterium]|nr:50S ribosomal protein L21 [Phycisphaeraceae bacterium]
MYAIIEDSGTQIKVSQGDVIKVAIRDLPADTATLTFDKVLMVGGAEGDAKIGAPHLAGAKVLADILGADRTDKVRVVKFKAKNYLRRKSHRQDFLKVKVTQITA